MNLLTITSTSTKLIPLPGDDKEFALSVYTGLKSLFENRSLKDLPTWIIVLAVGLGLTFTAISATVFAAIASFAFSTPFWSVAALYFVYRCSTFVAKALFDKTTKHTVTMQ